MPILNVFWPVFFEIAFSLVVYSIFPCCGIIRWNYFWNLYIFQIMENIHLSKRWCRLWFHKVVQATVHTMASYDVAGSMIGSTSIFRTLTKRSEMALLVL